MPKNVPAILSAILGVVVVVLFAVYAYQTQQEQELAEQHDLDSGSNRIALGVIGTVPSRDDIPNLDAIPWKLSQVTRQYNDAVERSCTSLSAGVPIRSLNESVRPDSAGFIGRIPIFTIGLRLDPTAIDDIPKTTRIEIERYLRDHIIVMELMLYHDKDGEPYIGVDCQAAVCEIGNPSTSIAAEPLITEAISRVRMLGLLENQQPAGGQTLVTAFRYTRSATDGFISVSGSKYETELFFTHLSADSSAENLKISVCATSGGRETFQRLNSELLSDFSGPPSITADIRFDSFAMMGLYPSEPVVTGVHPNTTEELSTDVLLRLISENKSDESWDFSQLLETFDSLLQDFRFPSSLATPNP